MGYGIRPKHSAWCGEWIDFLALYGIYTPPSGAPFTTQGNSAAMSISLDGEYEPGWWAFLQKKYM